MDRPPRFLDLFCGIGGLSLGLQQAGLRLVGIDVWGEALATFRHNHPGVKALEADITRVTQAVLEAEFGASATSPRHSLDSRSAGRC